MTQSAVYRYPRYYAIGYRWNTEVECDFIEACLTMYGQSHLPAPPQNVGRAPASPPSSGGAGRQAGVLRLLDIGCGAGRHTMELSRRGHRLTGVDVSPEMVAFVQEEAKKAQLPVTASVDDLRRLSLRGTFDAAFCFMDTFRFLLTNTEITAHLRTVAGLLAPGGLYLVDCWVPGRWDMIGNEIHQWEQTQGDTTVRVFYLQHPESIDPISQTFDDELVFVVEEPDGTREIRGGPTRTRLLLPQEFSALIDSSGVFTLRSIHGEFDLAKPFDRSTLSWRMISVLRKR